jgi:hypothetical protein
MNDGFQGEVDELLVQVYHVMLSLCVMSYEFYCRLREAGLLPLARMLQPIPGHADAKRRVPIDRSLLAALVDRWCPETHTFHLPCGEMAPTLQDVSYLLGLPISGTAVGPIDVPTWRADLTERFAGVQHAEDQPDFWALPNMKGPEKAWILQYTVRNCIL